MGGLSVNPEVAATHLTQQYLLVIYPLMEAWGDHIPIPHEALLHYFIVTTLECVYLLLSWLWSQLLVKFHE